ncbi:GntR family transcriptional regulator [Roseobacter weihaiensis]|uniref:GntR family transcriptional regulator n=1 Tax=Roseobacter weihaiensis TaxID=2763262 RepID=UPI001D0B66A6|nr:GntR family transcriptional regulator [Roseobacter sp. H9]
MDVMRELNDRRTSADIVFEALYKQIVGLELLPGTKMSEVEVAKRFDLSRQPVRDAFSRLSNLGLLMVRPQRSTIVRHFSLIAVRNARFIRTAIEVEVLRQACADRDVSYDDALRENLEMQRKVIALNNAEAFHELDYEFHRLLCNAARADFAFDVISSEKAQVDRLCMLSLTSKSAMEDLFQDHERIVDGLFESDAETADTALRCHLERLTPIIKKIHETHRDFFEN